MAVGKVLTRGAGHIYSGDKKNGRDRKNRLLFT